MGIFTTAGRSWIVRVLRPGRRSRAYRSLLTIAQPNEEASMRVLLLLTVLALSLTGTIAHASQSSGAGAGKTTFSSSAKPPSHGR
jgi:hypothetical protein